MRCLKFFKMRNVIYCRFESGDVGEEVEKK